MTRNQMIKILTFYRLTFGQPRQQELIEALHSYGLTDEEIEKLDELIINLSPIKFKCHNQYFNRQNEFLGISNLNILRI